MMATGVKRNSWLRVAAVWAAVCGAIGAVAAAADGPPELARRDADQMRASERAELERRVGLSVRAVVPGENPASGTDWMAMLEAADGPAEGEARVLVVQSWSARDRASVRLIAAAVRGIGTDLGERVTVAAVHIGEREGFGDGGDPFGLEEDRGEGWPAVVVVDDPEGAMAAAFGFDGEAGVNLVVGPSGVVRYAGVRPASLGRVAEGVLAWWEGLDGLEGDGGQMDPRDRATIADLVAADAAADMLRRAADEAFAAGDASAIDAAMAALWAGAPGSAVEPTIALATAGLPDAPLGIELLVEHADAETVLGVIDSLDARRQPDERRLLVRSLGPKLRALVRGGFNAEEAVEILGRFVTDRDLEVRVVALWSLADLGEPAGLPLVIARMESVPAEDDEFDGDAAARVNMARYGAAAAITGVMRAEPADYRRWFETWSEDPEEAAALTEAASKLMYPEAPAFNRQSDLWYPLRDIDLSYWLGGRGEGGEGAGPLSPEEFGPLLGGVNRRALIATEGTLAGPVLPVTRVFVVDEDGFSSLVGSSAFAGESNGIEVVLLRQDVELMEPVAVHERVHMLHTASFEDQPRWLAEGYAESATYSSPAGRSVWTAGRVAETGISEDLQEGLLEFVIGWGGPASGTREARRYSASHLLVDYLQYGPFTAGDTRLAFLMGALSRGASDRRAIEDVYGLDREGLDEAVQSWVRGRGGRP